MLKILIKQSFNILRSEVLCKIRWHVFCSCKDEYSTTFLWKMEVNSIEYVGEHMIPLILQFLFYSSISIAIIMTIQILDILQQNISWMSCLNNIHNSKEHLTSVFIESSLLPHYAESLAGESTCQQVKMSKCINVCRISSKGNNIAHVSFAFYVIICLICLLCLGINL